MDREGSLEEAKKKLKICESNEENETSSKEMEEKKRRLVRESEGWA